MGGAWVNTSHLYITNIDELNNVNLLREVLHTPSDAGGQWFSGSRWTYLTNSDPVGICGVGNLLWVADRTANRLYAYTEAGVATPTRDIVLHASNNNARGIWSDGAVIWVIDDDADDLFAYDLTTGAHLPERRIALHANNTNAVDLWGEDGVIWALDSVDRRVYGYQLDNGDYNPQLSFDIGVPASRSASQRAGQPGRPVARPQPVRGRGRWLRFKQSSSGALAAQYLPDSAPVYPGFHETLSSAQLGVNPAGLAAGNAANADDLWVNMASTTAGYRIARPFRAPVGYRHATYTPATFAADAGSAANGLAVDGNVLWVMQDRRVSAGAGGVVIRPYNKTTGATDTTRSIVALPAVNGSPAGMVVATNTLWVSDSADGVIYVYNLLTGGRLTSRDLNAAAAGNANPLDLSIHDGVLYAADGTDRKIYAYRLDTGARLPGLDLETETLAAHGLAGLRGLAAHDGRLYATVPGADRVYGIDWPFRHRRGDNVRGVWSNASLLWAVDAGEDRLHAYRRPGGARAADRDIVLHASNSDPWGAWSDGTVMWVADTADNRLYAYNLADGSYNSARSATLATANADPRGLWSDGATIWVADHADARLYAYNLLTGAAEPARDLALDAANAAPHGRLVRRDLPLGGRLRRPQGLRLSARRRAAGGAARH